MNFDRLKSFLDYELPSYGIPGSDTIIYHGRNEVFRHTTGYDSLKDKNPMNPSALYNLYSCTKVATAVAATQLIERGMIVVTDPIYDYFPEFKDVRVAVRDDIGSLIDTRPVKNHITIHHLLTMTSGLNYNLDVPAIKRFKEETDGKCPTVKFPSYLAAEPLDFEPGERWCYGLSLDVIGALIELVSGVSLGEYMNENIFDPIGMKSTSFGFTDENVKRLATQYNYDPDRCAAVEIPKNFNRYVFGTEYESAGAGLISSVDDQIMFVDTLTYLGLAKNGNRILSERGVNLIRSDMLSAEVYPSFNVSHFRGYTYGYGVRVNKAPHLYGNLSPLGEFGWDGAKMSYISCDPENKISMFHAEHMGGLYAKVWPRLRNLLYSSFDY